MRLGNVLKEDGLRSWAVSPERAHIKLLSLRFVCFAGLLGHSILCDKTVLAEAE